MDGEKIFVLALAIFGGAIVVWSRPIAQKWRKFQSEMWGFHWDDEVVCYMRAAHIAFGTLLVMVGGLGLLGVLGSRGQ
jgi:hypothetical protein